MMELTADGRNDSRWWFRHTHMSSRILNKFGLTLPCPEIIWKRCICGRGGLVGPFEVPGSSRKLPGYCVIGIDNLEFNSIGSASGLCCKLSSSVICSLGGMTLCISGRLSGYPFFTHFSLFCKWHLCQYLETNEFSCHHNSYMQWFLGQKDWNLYWQVSLRDWWTFQVVIMFSRFFGLAECGWYHASLVTKPCRDFVVAIWDCCLSKIAPPAYDLNSSCSLLQNHQTSSSSQLLTTLQHIESSQIKTV